MFFRCTVGYFVNDLGGVCLLCAHGWYCGSERLMNCGIGLLIKDTLTVWKNKLVENSWSLSSLKDGRGKFTRFSIGRKEDFKIPFHYRAVKVAFRIFQWLKEVILCDPLWSQEEILHFSVVASSVVFMSWNRRRTPKTDFCLHPNFGIFFVLTTSLSQIVLF